MSAFSSRSGGYKVGVIMLFFTTAAFLVGFGAPYWSSVELVPGVWTYNSGLWMVCHFISSRSVVNYRYSGCASYGIDVGWLEHVVRVLTCVCMICLVIACIYALATNCCRTIPGPRSRVIEVLAIVGGIAGFVGAMLYVGLKDHLSTDLSSLFTGTRRWELAWAFYLTAVGSAASVLAGIIVAVSNKLVEGPAFTGGMVMTTVPAQPGYHHQPQPQPQTQPYGFQPAAYPEAKAGYPAPY